MTLSLVTIGRFWLTRLVWLVVAMSVLVLVVFVPSGFVSSGEKQQREGNSSPVPQGFFVIEPWEMRSISQAMTWDSAQYRGAVTGYVKAVLNDELEYHNRWGDAFPASDKLKPAGPRTLRLFGISLVAGTAVGILGGLATSALRLLRAPLLGFAVGGLSVPDFLLVIGGQLLTIWSFRTFGVRLWSVGVPDSPSHWVLPALALSIPVAAYTLRLTLASFDDIMREDYIRTARAKGLTRWRILMGHALRNAWPRVLNGLPALVNVTLSSLVVVEFMTSWSGLGLLMAPWSEMPISVRLTAALIYAVWFALAEGLAQTIRLVVSPRLREAKA